MCSGASVMLRGVSSRVCSWGAASRQRMASLTESGHAVLYDTSCSLGLHQAQGTPQQMGLTKHRAWRVGYVAQGLNHQV